MKKEIIIGTMLAVFLVTMLPSVCALESNIVKGTWKSQFSNIIPEIDIDKLIIKYMDNPAEPLIITTLIIFLLKLVRGILSGTIAFLKIVRGIMLVIKIFLLTKILGNTTGMVI